jgi:hypothetical protein
MVKVHPPCDWQGSPDHAPQNNKIGGWTGDQEVWARNLSDGSVAVGLYNKNGAPTPPAPPAVCPTWNTTQGGYLEACGGPSGDLGCFTGLTASQAQQTCCNNPACAGLSFKSTDGSGCYKANTQVRVFLRRLACVRPPPDGL